MIYEVINSGVYMALLIRVNSLKEGVTLFEKEMFEIKPQKQKSKKIIPSPYIYLEEDKTSGYVSYGGFMIQINPQRRIRISEREKLWFD